MPIRPENRHRYPKDWPKISRRIRFERAQGRCECTGECGRGTHNGRCSNIHGQHAYSTGSKVVLTVAHLDHTPENCNPANLRAMCQGCHLHYDRDHHRQTAAATRRAAAEAAGQLTLDAPVYAVHCFFNCPHVVRDTDPDAAHDAMEQHYSERHSAHIRRVLTEDPPSPTDPPQRRRRRR